MTFFHQLRSGFKKIDKFLDQEILLILLLALVIVLRIPNFFEPYWYGDEGIYLAVGEALNKGAILYKDIIDHKTPLIYFLARVPNQVSFRVLNLLWMLFTTGFFYLFAKRLFKKKKPAFIASLIMVLFTTLPLLEGNIPNGELFVMGFVMLAAYLLSFTPFFKLYFQEKREELSELNKISKKEFLLLSTAGISF